MVSEGPGATSNMKKPCPKLEIGASRRPGSSSASLGSAKPVGDRPVRWCLSPFWPGSVFFPRFLKGPFSVCPKGDGGAEPARKKRTRRRLAGCGRPVGRNLEGPRTIKRQNVSRLSRDRHQGCRLTMWKTTLDAFYRRASRTLMVFPHGKAGPAAHLLQAPNRVPV
jgi:hypothetical protein